MVPLLLGIIWLNQMYLEDTMELSGVDIWSECIYPVYECDVTLIILSWYMFLHIVLYDTNLDNW